MEQNKKVCPMLSDRDKLVYCLENACAWYYQDTCAHLELATKNYCEGIPEEINALWQAIGSYLNMR